MNHKIRYYYYRNTFQMDTVCLSSWQLLLNCSVYHHSTTNKYFPLDSKSICHCNLSELLLLRSSETSLNNWLLEYCMFSENFLENSLTRIKQTTILFIFIDMLSQWTRYYRQVGDVNLICFKLVVNILCWLPFLYIKKCNVILKS